MAEESQQQVQQEPQQQVTTKEPQQITTKNSKKVEVGKGLAAHNCRIREAKKREDQAQRSELNQYYGTGVVLAVGVKGGLGYYIYPTKKGPTSRKVKDVSMPHNPTVSQQPFPQSNKFEMIKSLLYYKNGQEEYSK